MASSALDLLFRIKADDQASPTVKKLRSTFDAETKAIESSGKTSFLKLGDSVGFSTSQMAGLAKAMPLVATGITAIAGAAVAGAVGLFALAKETADFGSKIFDASQKTGLHAEALSALKFAAEQSGGSLEDLEVGLKIFTRTIGEAARGSDEAKDKLMRLGIDATKPITDLQGALAIAIKTINDAPEGILRTNAAMDAFGSRSGPNLVTTIKTMDGELLKFIAHAKALGVTLTDEDVAAADKFGDTLDLLGTQFAAVGHRIALQFMPEIQKAMETLSKFLSENQAMFKEWGNNISDLVSGAMPALKEAFGGLDNALSQNAINWKELGEGMGFWLRQAGRVIQGIIILGRDLAWLGRQFSREQPGGDRNLTTWAAGKTPGAAVSTSNADGPDLSWMEPSAYDMTRTGKPGGGGAGKAQQVANQALAVAMKEAERLYKQENADSKRWYEQHIISLREFTENIKGELEKRFEAEETALNNRIALANKETDKDKFRAELEEKRAEKDRAIQAAQDNQDNKEIASLEAHLAELMKIYEDFGRRKIASVNRFAAAGKVSYEQAAQTELDITTNIYNRRLEILARQEEAAGADAELRVKINDQLRALNQEQEAFQDEHNAKMEEARVKDAEREQAKLDESLERQRKYLEAKQEADRQAEQRRIDMLLAADEAFRTQTFGGGILDALGMFDPNRIKTIGEAWAAAGQVVVGAFGAMANAVGQLVSNWVLMGNTGPGAIKKMVASVLAGVAAQAAVLSIFELAKGFAAMFWNPPEAAAHFMAAALFGSLAAITAVAGRAFAGNLFQQQGAGASAGAGGGTGGGTGARGYEAPTTNVREQDRNQRKPFEFVFRVESNDSHILKVLQQDAEGNGWMRQKFAFKTDI